MSSQTREPQPEDAIICSCQQLFLFSCGGMKIFPQISIVDIRRVEEHCVNAREDDESKRKLAAHTAAINIFKFKQLLDEASEDITEKTNYEYFAKKWGHDERFEALDRSKRESLLNERVLSLRQDLQEKGKTRQATPIASFKAMLSDSGDINSNSEWSKDGHEHRRNEDLDRAIALSLIEEEQREDGHEHSGNEDLDHTIALSLNEEEHREDGHEHSGNEDLDLPEDLDRAIALSLCEEEKREVNSREDSSQVNYDEEMARALQASFDEEIARALQVRFDDDAGASS